MVDDLGNPAFNAEESWISDIIEHAERSGEATMVRAIRNRHGVTKKQFKVTTRGILKAAVEAEKLGTKVLYWVNEIHDLVEKLSQQGGVQEPL